MKGRMGGSMTFGVGDALTPKAQDPGPLLPLRLLVVADLTPRDPHNAGASPPSAAIRVDPQAFDDLFARLRPRIAIEVPSVLAEGRPARVDLAPSGMRSLRPDGLCAEVPLLRSLLDGRLVLERLRDVALTKEQAEDELSRVWSGSPFAREVLGLVAASAGSRAAVGQASRGAAAAEPAADALDAMLSMVDLGSGAGAEPAEEASAPRVPAKVESPLSGLIAEVARSGRGGGGFRPAEALLRVDRAIGAQIGAILQHPEVRRLEQALRGLRFLAERTQGHDGVRLDVVSARAEDAAAALDRVLKAIASTGAPVSAAIVDVTVDGTAASFARLESIAAVAEAHTAPVLVNGAPSLLGVGAVAELLRLDVKAARWSAKEGAPWRATAQKPSLRWVTIGLNPALGRPAYDKSTSRVREANVKELPDDAGSAVWIAPAYLLGALIAQSFRETGWPCRISGGKAGTLGDLPVREVKVDDDSDVGVAIPTEAFLSTDTQRELARVGVLALASAPNSDAIYVQSAPTAYVQPDKRSYDSATTEPEERLPAISLGDQLFVARVAQLLRALCGKLPSNSDPGEVEPVVEGALWALFEGKVAPGTLDLTVKVASRGGETVASVVLKPRRFLGVTVDEVALAMPLG
jgi:type VI secretion system protein ImpC